MIECIWLWKIRIITDYRNQIILSEIQNTETELYDTRLVLWGANFPDNSQYTSMNFC